MQTNYHFFDLPHHKTTELSPFYIAVILRTFVISFLVLFLPVLIMNTYLLYGERIAMAAAIGYFMYASFNQMLLIVIASKAASLWGLRTNFLVSHFCLIIFILLIMQEIYALAFFMLSFSAMFWWYSYHIYFTGFGKKEEYGREIGLLEAVSVLTGSIAPLIGGLILVNAGIGSFYAIAIVVIFMSTVFIFFFKEPRKLKSIGYSDIYKNIKKNKNDFLAFIGAGAEESIATIIWPILLFLLFKDYFKIGIYFSGVMIVVVLINYIVGSMTDNTKKEKLEEIGSIAVFFSWIGRAFIQHPLLLSIVEVVYKLFLSFFKLPLLAIAYAHAPVENEDYIAFREFSYKIGAIAGFTCFIIIVLTGMPIWFILVCSALFSLLPLTVRRKNNKYLPNMMPQ